MTRILALTLLAFALSAPAAHSATWTEVPSGTTDDITAIEYQGPGKLWYATGASKLYRRTGDTGQLSATSATSTVFKDIAFNSTGTIGFAVGTNGVLMRTANGGENWTAVTLPNGGRQLDNNCAAADQAPGDLDSVTFAGDTRAWVTGQGTQIYRTVAGATAADVGSSTAGWQYVNDEGATCRITQNVDDVFPVPGGDNVYFVSDSFGAIWFSSNALTTAATKKAGSAGNGFDVTRRLVGDPGNPNRQWSTSAYGTGGSYQGLTIDAWSTGGDMVVKTERGFDKMFGLDFAGGTVLLAGDAGAIANSIDGTNFYVEDAGGALATQGWRSAALASATDGAIGGTGGKLALTTTANQLRDNVKPTGTIAGPSTGTAGQPLTFTATLADEAGGSGINAAASNWTTPGLTNQTGPTATFTFPQPGSYLITLTFADNAGNSATATKAVDVRAGSTTPPGGSELPKPTLPGSSSPPLSGGVAKKKGKFVVFKVKGRLGLPAGISKKDGCKGTMSLSVYKGKKRLVGKTAKVATNCNYKKTVKVRRSKVGKAKSLKLKVAFRGNAKVSKVSSTYKVKVR